MVPKRDGDFVNILKSIYNNEFQWNFIKSLGVFVTGVRIAYLFAGTEIMPAVTH